MDSASAQPAGLSAPAVGSSSLDAARSFTELAGFPIDEFWQEARCESVDLRRDEFADALVAMEVTGANNRSLDYGREAPRTQFAAYMERSQKRIAAQAEQRMEDTYDAAENAKDCGPEWPVDVNPVDPWGHKCGESVVFRVRGRSDQSQPC